MMRGSRTVPDAYAKTGKAGDSTVQDLEDLLKPSREIRRPFEGQWRLNLAFFAGQQWVAWDGQRLYEPATGGKVRRTDNRIRGAILTDVAKMTKQQPVFVAAPRSADQEDLEAALIAERGFDWAWTEYGFTRKRRQALLWSRVATAGFISTMWDPQAGKSVRVLVGPDGKALRKGDGSPVDPNDENVDAIIGALPDEWQQGVNERTVAMGDLCFEVKTPFQMIPDEHAGEDGLESAGWIADESVQPLADMQARYPNFADKLSEDAVPQAGIVESRLSGWARPSSDRKRGVKVTEFWANPGSRYPQGKRCVWACGQLLHEGPNDYGWLPYVMFRGSAMPGRFWPDCPVTHLIDPQLALNKRISQIDENASRIGNSPLMIPESMDEDLGWEGEPGEIWRYNALGTPDSFPRFLEVPEVPGYVREDVSRIEQSFREISGQHEVTSAQVPAGVTAASAINLLLEQDDTRLGPDIEDQEAALGNLGTRVLDLMGRYFTDERIMRLAGEDDAWEIFTFRGQQLREHTDISVQAGSGMPRSKAAKQAAMQQMLDLVLRYGLQLDQRTLRKFFKEYEVGGLERMFADISEDERKVNRENRRLGLGEPVAVNPWDNHEFEIAAHNEFRKSQRYELLVKSNPDVAAAFEAHVGAHMMAIAPPPLPVPPGSPETVTPGSPSQNGAPSSPLGPLPSPLT